MDEYEGSPELDVDLELLSLYEKRLERAIRVKDKVRRLNRHHKVFLSDVNKLNDNLERAKMEATQALAAKKKALEGEIERKYQDAMGAIEDEIQARKLPLDQAVSEIGRSNKVLEAALETLEDKIKEPQHEFIQRFVPMIEA